MCQTAHITSKAEAVRGFSMEGPLSEEPRHGWEYVTGTGIVGPQKCRAGPPLPVKGKCNLKPDVGTGRGCTRVPLDSGQGQL